MPTCSPRRHCSGPDGKRSAHDCLYASPASLYPGNRVLDTQQRKALLESALSQDQYVVEDMFGSESRSGNARFPSIQSLDLLDRVCVIGDFDTTLSAAMHVAYLAVPKSFPGAVHGHALAQQGVSWLAQAQLSEFLGGGTWSAHMRKIRAAARFKHETMCHAVAEDLGADALVCGQVAGTFVAVEIQGGDCSTRDLVWHAARNGIRIPAPLPTDSARLCLPLCHAGIQGSSIPAGIAALAEVLRLHGFTGRR